MLLASIMTTTVTQCTRFSQGNWVPSISDYLGGTMSMIGNQIGYTQRRYFKRKQLRNSYSLMLPLQIELWLDETINSWPHWLLQNQTALIGV